MLDFTHLPTLPDVQEFLNPARTDSNQTVGVWVKPRGARMVSIILIGSGGGGSANTVFGVSTAGGGGGGSAGVSTLIIPAMFLPDELYISLRGGGAGGSSASTRGTSYITITPQSSIANECVALVNNGARGGVPAGGAAGGAVSVTAACIAGTGIYRGIAGSVGGTSAAAAVGGTGGPVSGVLTFSGGGGGGTPAAAGNGNRGGHNNWMNSATWPDRNQAAGGVATSDGTDGYWGGFGCQIGDIPLRYGGTGGNSSGGSAPANRGGNGGNCDPRAWGAGGGGGGAGLASNAANGGWGGGSFCRITSW